MSFYPSLFGYLEGPGPERRRPSPMPVDVRVVRPHSTRRPAPRPE
jgi:hypothetical protein